MQEEIYLTRWASWGELDAIVSLRSRRKKTLLSFFLDVVLKTVLEKKSLSLLNEI